MIYFDNAATTVVRQEVVDVIMNTMKEYWGNPSSSYEFGVSSRRLIEEARKVIAKSINANPSEIIFTSGASESNAIAIDGFRKANNDYELLVSKIEHSSILKCEHKSDYEIEVNSYGYFDIKDLVHKLDCCRFNLTKPLVSIQGANNEIGIIQNITEIAGIVHKYDGIYHCDLTQLYPYEKINIKALNVDLASFSGHKFGAPKGIGFLYVKDNIKLNSIIHGTQENGVRGGTENLPYICGMAKAVELLMKDLDSKPCGISNYDNINTVKHKRDYLLDKIYECCNECGVAVHLNGSINSRLPNNINIQLCGIDSQMFIALMDQLQNIEISSGSACHAHEKIPSFVLKAIGLSDEAAKESIRITLSNENTYDEIDEFIKGLRLILTQFVN